MTTKIPLPKWVSSGPFKSWTSTAKCASCENMIEDAWNNGVTCHGCLKKVHKITECYNLWKYPWVINLSLYEPEELSTPDKLCKACFMGAKDVAVKLSNVGIRYTEPGAKDKYRAYTEARSGGAASTSSSALWGKLDMQDNAFVVAVKRVMDAIFPGNRSWRVLLDNNHKVPSTTHLKAREITLPNIWKSPAALGQSQETILDTMTGMAIHETGHAQYTELETSQRLQREVKDRQYSEKAALAILNIVEDYFLERKIKDRFPAFGSYFRHSYMWTLENTRTELLNLLAQPNGDQLFGVRVAVATWEILCPGELEREGMVIPPPLKELVQQVRELLATNFNTAFMEKPLNRADVAIKVYELLKTDELKCTQECKEQQKQFRNAGNSGYEFAENCPVHSGDDEGLVAMLANGDQSNNQNAIAARKYQDQVSTAKEEIVSNQRQHAREHQTRIDRLAPVIQEMRKVLQLRNTQAANQRKNLRSGRLTRRSISRLSTTGATDVFHQKLPDQFPKVRIGFIVDESGSMSNSIGAARDACVAIHEAAKQIKGVKTWTWGFSTGNGGGRLRRYGSPNDRAIPAIELAMMDGGTPTGPCMDKAAEVLIHGAGSDEKIYCFIMTDGYADSSPTPGEVVGQYPQVTFVHVGIGGVADPGIPAYVGPVRSARELPPLMMDTVLQILQK